MAAREALQKSAPGAEEAYGDAAEVISSSPTRRGINIFAAEDAPVVAVNDGVVRKLGSSKELGKFIVLEDTYGNRYTYAGLGEIVRRHRSLVMPTGKEQRLPVESENLRPRLRALPERDEKVTEAPAPGPSNGKLKVGSRVIAGTVLARVGAAGEGVDPHINFSIRPAGRGAPRIDPKPILDGWKLLESTAIYRAANRNPFVGKDAAAPSIGQILLMNKDALAQRVLNDPNVQIYGCGRQDIRAGQIDRRVLATLEFLVSSGLKPTVTSLKCGHSFLTTSGNVSEHTTGTAVDIAAINGIPILGHQGAGSITEMTIQRLLTLQGTMKPHQIISLMTFPGTDNTLALSDHDDHIHVGFRPLYGANRAASKQVDAALKPEQWIKLIERLDQIDNPKVDEQPSQYAVKAGKRASPAHKGE